MFLNLFMFILENAPLLDIYRLVDVVDVHTIDQLKSVCAEHSRGETTYSHDLEAMFFTPSATQALYNIEV